MTRLPGMTSPAYRVDLSQMPIGPEVLYDLLGSGPMDDVSVEQLARVGEMPISRFLSLKDARRVYRWFEAAGLRSMVLYANADIVFGSGAREYAWA